VIDQVWHEHQLFTQAYRRFCRELLGRHFDHHPELIRADEQLADYQAQYHGTLALYQQEFNQEPPPDIWLVPKFQEARIAAETRRPGSAASWIETSSYGDAPLYTFFESDAAEHGSGFDAFDGGQSGGGGGGADWSDGTGADAGSTGADAGSSDGGGSSCGGSSCSSGCGGGGGGD
jgi:hypothetical protein